MRSRNYLVALVMLQGCSALTGLCIDETRGVQLEARLTSRTGTADEGSAGFWMYEARRGEGHRSSEQSVLYWARSTLDRATVSVVRLRAGTEAAPGRILFDFPIEPQGDPSNITATNTNRAYHGPIEFRELFNAVVAQSSFIEVYQAGRSQPTLVGQTIRPAGGASSWDRAYCS